jgi:alpha-glucosidase
MSQEAIHSAREARHARVCGEAMNDHEQGEHKLWWQRGVIYQIYPRSFQDSNGDGVGDLSGILQRLDYLSEVLKVDAIWLSPIFPSPMADFGYDVSDYTDIHPMFGTLDDFDALLSAAHARGLRLIIDFVPNHTSDQHPWFLESRSSRQSPKRDWYIWRDPKPDGSLPNNWASMFGGAAWEWDETTGQYYLHTFLREQPDLNWRNPAVKAAMLDVLRFWLDRGVDGFRIDVAHFIMKDPDLRDNPPNPNAEMSGTSTHGWAKLEHVHDLGHPDVHAVFREIRQVLDQYDGEHPRVTIGEIHEFDWSTWVLYYGERLDELHMPFNFALLNVVWNAANVRVIVESVESVVRSGAWPNYVLGNHDTHRLASRIGVEQSRVAMMLLLTLRGTPTMYYGEELGMQDVDIRPDLVQDPYEKNIPGVGLGRDPERTPMQWDASENAGFAPPDTQPWLPIADAYTTVNVATELQSARSMLNLIRGLLELRRTTPALHSGTYASVNVDDADCYVYLREGEGGRFLVALNFTDQLKTLTVPELDRGKVCISTHPDTPEAEVNRHSLSLRPNEGCVVELLSPTSDP